MRKAAEAWWESTILLLSKAFGLPSQGRPIKRVHHLKLHEFGRFQS